jgi:uncharacterized protein (TIGR02687 family)
MMRDRIQAGLERSFRKHRIVFWHDPQTRFREEFEEIAIPGVTKTEVANNEFMLKHRLIREEPRQPFLVYRPGPVPEDARNWLLDLEMGNGVFLADRGALLLMELGLPPRFGDLIETHARYFEAKVRVGRLKGMIEETDNAADIRLKMIAVCAGTPPKLDEVLETLLSELARDEERLIGLITRSGLEPALWDEVRTVYGYTEAAPSVSGLAQGIFAGTYAMELDEPTRLTQEALVLMARWRHDTRHRDAFQLLSARYAEALQISADLAARPLDRLVRMTQFEVIDQQVLRALIQGVLDRDLPHERVEETVRERRSGLWWETYEPLYEAVLCASDLQRRLTDVPIPAMTMRTGFDAYTATWFQVDQLYRKFVLNVGRSVHRDLISDLSERVENLYSNNFLMPLNDAWQRAIDADPSWKIEQIVGQRRFYEQHVAPIRNRGSKVIVIISDALRYEIGEELLRLIRKVDRFEARLEPMLGTVPSYTQLGMGALLPNRDLRIAPEGSGVLVDGESASGTENRAKVLARRTDAGTTTAVQAEAVARMDKDAMRALIRDHDVVYVYHNLIDAVGDKAASEGRVFEAAEDALKELENLVRRLAGNNASNLIITADHGFIFQNRPIHEGDYSPAEVRGEKITHRDRRFVLGTGLEQTDGLTRFTPKAAGLEGETEILIPRSIGRLRLSGSGSRFVHGGAALQEVVVPVLLINKRRASDVEQVDVEPILTSTRLITTGQHTVRLYQTLPVTEKRRMIRLRIGLYGPDGTPLTNEEERSFEETSEDARRRETTVRLILGKAADAFNDRDVRLVLTRVGDGPDRPYRTETFRLKRSISGDFDI